MLRGSRVLIGGVVLDAECVLCLCAFEIVLRFFLRSLHALFLRLLLLRLQTRGLADAAQQLEAPPSREPVHSIVDITPTSIIHCQHLTLLRNMIHISKSPT